jgi:hypothetical protein
MPKLVCLLAATLMLVSGAANAHSWYPKECCHDNDCHPIPCSDIAVKNGQVIWNGVELSWPTVRPSEDTQCHVCSVEDPWEPVPRCLFIPKGDAAIRAPTQIPT